MRFKVTLSLFLIVGIFSAACSMSGPPERSSGNRVGAAKNPKAFTLIGVKNDTEVGSLSSNPGARYAQLLTKATLFAVIDCIDTQSTSSRTKLGDLETNSVLGLTYLDAKRRVLKVTPGEEKKRVFCIPRGNRMISAPVFDRMLSIPYEKKEATTNEDYFVAQVAFLALRGLYIPGEKPFLTAGLQSYLRMKQEHSDKSSAHPALLQEAMQKMDPDFNPCFKGSEQGVLPRAVSDMRNRFYICVNAGKGYSYELSNSVPYDNALKIIADRVSALHEELYGKPASGTDWLWDMVTGMKPWTKPSAAQKDVGVLLRGQQNGVSYERMFSSTTFGDAQSTSIRTRASKPSMRAAAVRAPLQGLTAPSSSIVNEMGSGK